MHRADSLVNVKLFIFRLALVTLLPMRLRWALVTIRLHVFLSCFSVRVLLDGLIVFFDHDKGLLLFALVPSQSTRNGIEPIGRGLVGAYGRERVLGGSDFDVISLCRLYTSAGLPC